MPRFSDQSAQKRVTKFVLHGSLIVAIALTGILILYDLTTQGQVCTRIFIAIGAIAYLIIGEVLMRTRYFFWVNWLIILLYGVVAYTTLFIWGLNTPIGILSAGFIVILPSLLIGSHYILPATATSITILFAIQLAHETKLYTPEPTTLSRTASFWDFTVYATIFAIFALVSWLSRRQIESSLLRAQKAEAIVKAQKEELRVELESESRRLREAQLQELQRLYKFAIIGQSTTATLHELSNHLSILNIDLDDLRQQSRNSRAIENANDTIMAINRMVQAVRRQLNSYDEHTSFRALPVLRKTIRDLSGKFSRKNVTLRHDFTKLKAPCYIDGDELALIQVISVLAMNALDACEDFDNGKVIISAETTPSSLIVTVRDNGIGISSELQESLFSPVHSTKPSGLGVGLYVARHITKSHFNGSISFDNLPTGGTSFTVTLPRSRNSNTARLLPKNLL